MGTSTTKSRNTSGDPLLSGAQDFPSFSFEGGVCLRQDREFVNVGAGEYRFAVGEAGMYHVGVDPTAVWAFLNPAKAAFAV